MWNAFYNEFVSSSTYQLAMMTPAPSEFDVIKDDTVPTPCTLQLIYMDTTTPKPTQSLSAYLHELDEAVNQWEWPNSTNTSDNTTIDTSATPTTNKTQPKHHWYTCHAAYWTCRNGPHPPHANHTGHPQKLTGCDNWTTVCPYWLPCWPTYPILW